MYFALATIYCCYSGHFHQINYIWFCSHVGMGALSYKFSCLIIQVFMYTIILA